MPLKYRDEVFRVAHVHASSGHFGVQKTYDRIIGEYYWPGLYADTRQFVLECLECQKYKIPSSVP